MACDHDFCELRFNDMHVFVSLLYNNLRPIYTIAVLRVVLIIIFHVPSNV